MAEGSEYARFDSVARRRSAHTPLVGKAMTSPSVAACSPRDTRESPCQTSTLTDAQSMIVLPCSPAHDPGAKLAGRAVTGQATRGISLDLGAPLNRQATGPLTAGNPATAHGEVPTPHQVLTCCVVNSLESCLRYQTGTARAARLGRFVCTAPGRDTGGPLRRSRSCSGGTTARGGSDGRLSIALTA